MAAKLGAILSDAIRFREVTQKCFNEDDIDCSGCIDSNELQRVMTRVAQVMGARVPTQEDVRLTMQSTDLNHDGTINFEEYQEFARKLLTSMYQKMTMQHEPETKSLSKTPELASPEAAKVSVPLQQEVQRSLDSMEPAQDPIAGQIPALPETKARSKTPILAPPEEAVRSNVVVPPEVRKPLDRITEPTQNRVSEQIPRSPSQVHPPPQRVAAGAAQLEVKRTSKSEALSQRMNDFEEYLNYWRLNDAVMQIFTEVESKKIEPTQVYQYAATRLRQLGKDPRFLKH